MGKPAENLLNETLLDSVGEEPAEQVEQAWIEEAKRRLAEVSEGRVEPVPWEEARARIFARG